MLDLCGRRGGALPPLSVDVTGYTHDVIGQERGGAIGYSHRVEKIAKSSGGEEPLGGVHVGVGGRQHRQECLHPGLGRDKNVTLADRADRAKEAGLAGRGQLRGVYTCGDLENHRHRQLSRVAAVGNADQIENLAHMAYGEYLLVIGEVEGLVQQSNDRVDPVVTLGNSAERNYTHTPSVATEAGVRAEVWARGTVGFVRKGLIVALVVGIGSLGVVAGISVGSRDGGGGEAGLDLPGTGPEAIDLGGSGPDCIGGLCLNNLPDSIGYEEVGSYLAALQKGLAEDPRPETANTCHSVAHEVGRRAVKSGAGVERLLDLDDGRCLYGYQHGVLEGWSLQSSLEEVVGGIPTACRAYEDGRTVGGLGGEETEYAIGSCAHGLGHAISLQNLGSVAEAVAYCGGAGAGKVGGCAGGVFMAYASENPSQGGSGGALRLDRDEVLNLCPSLAGEWAQECWSKLWLLGSRVGIRAEEVAAACPKSGAEACGRGVGEGLYYEKSLEVVEALEACPSNVREQCVYGVAWANANSWVGSGNSSEGYESICGTIGEINVEACRKSEGEALKGAVN